MLCGRPRNENGHYCFFWGGGALKKKVDAVKTEVDDLSMRLETRDKERKEQVRHERTNTEDAPCTVEELMDETTLETKQEEVD